MPRAPRIEFAGAIYHVMNRGNHLSDIFKDDHDRETFLRTLEETCESSGWWIHSFVLMCNHYHLLIETTRCTLVRGMQYLNSTYTRRYNLRHRTFGHLFQGRYKALLVDGEESGYFLTVSDYIHMNPVRAKQVSNFGLLMKDRWNSVGWLAGMRKKRPEWLRWERVYGELGLKGWGLGSRREYRQYLGRRMEEIQADDPQWKKIRRGWCIGSTGFVERMKGKLLKLAEEPRDRESWNDSASEEMEEVRAWRLLQQGIGRLGYDSLEKMKGDDRFILGKWLREGTRVSVKWLSKQLGLKTRGGMSSSLYKLNQRIRSEPKLQKRWEQINI